MTERKTYGYMIDCKGDVVVGDKIEFVEGVFCGVWPRGSFVGHRTIRAEVVADSYGQGRQQHTFTLRVIESLGIDRIRIGAKIYRRGRTVYRNGTHRQAWPDESSRKPVADEKHARGKQARADKTERLNYGF